jgi:hypothetical protein
LSENQSVVRPMRKEATGYQVDGRRMGLPLPSKPWMPAPFDRSDIAALKAMRDGSADPEQQKRVLAWIVEYAARTYATSFDPGSARSTTLNEGSRLVGQQIVKLLNWRETINEEQGK